ncbi:MAG: hypothetical protein M3450_19650, partial [Actinomycetota bacterium]|nr:hypothetical protein [Actinomycetota bacterium]
MSTASTITRPQSTRMTAIGLVIAAAGVLAIIPVRAGQDAGFALVVGPLLLLSAGLVWRYGLVRRYGLPAHIWAAVLGVLLVLMHGSYAIVGFSDGGELRIVLLDVAIAVGAAVALFGAASYIAGRR